MLCQSLQRITFSECSDPLLLFCGRHDRGTESRRGRREGGGRAAVAAGHAEPGPPQQHHARSAGLPAAQPGVLEEASPLQSQMPEGHWHCRQVALHSLTCTSCQLYIITANYSHSCMWSLLCTVTATYSHSCVQSQLWVVLGKRTSCYIIRSRSYTS